MFARAVTQEEVEAVIRYGETIAAYPTNKPYPSVLRLGFVNSRPIHIVVAQDELGECYVVTATSQTFFFGIPISNRKRDDLFNL